MNPLLTYSGRKLATLIRNGELKSREVLDVHIAHIESTNPYLNALVAERFEEARREADRADRLVQRHKGTELPPYHGVPCTIKECFQVKGMPHTAGLKRRVRVRPHRDAVAVTRLRQAGAIPVGVTNVSELCMWMESYNPVYGRTNNAYNTKRTAGGSSGGEGAIIGAGGSPFGLGADIGGSIRMPAFFNGVFGHKPTGGLVPHAGHFPKPENAIRRYNTVGPLARCAEDLMPLLKILAGASLKDPECVSLKTLTVYSIEDNGCQQVSRELKNIQKLVAHALAREGARIEKLTIPSLKHSFEIWAAMVGAESRTSFRQLMGNGTAINPFLELFNWLKRDSNHSLPAILLAILEMLHGLQQGRIKKYVQRGRQLRTELTKQLGPNAVILYPSYVSTAPRHYQPLWPPFNWVYTAIFNVLEFPVTQVPLGLGRKGLPVGIQVASIPGNDHVTIAVAQVLETIFGGWVPPPKT